MDNITVITWPPGRRSLMAQMLEICLGDHWKSLVETGKVLTATDGANVARVVPHTLYAQTPELNFLIEFEEFPLSCVMRFAGFVAKGGEDSAAAFTRFASEDFARYEAFAARWINSAYGQNQVLVDAAELRANTQAWLQWALSVVAPGVTPSAETLAEALQVIHKQPAAQAVPDISAFRFFDPALFALIGNIKLRRDVVQRIFHDLMGRDLDETHVLHFQQIATREALERNLRATKEYKLRANSPLPVGGTHAAVAPEVVLSPEFQRAERKRKNALRWPLTQVFYSRKAQVIYCPIGKVACTFLKRLMVQISDVGHPELLLKDVHGLTDNLRTGLQLGDYPEAEARALIEAPEIFKFAVLRPPQERLLSAYIEKFVVERQSTGNLYHTRAVVAGAQARKGIAPVDPALGISFRDFIVEITSHPSNKLDPHWRPQSDYLAGISYDKIYSFDQINDVVDMLEERSGITLPRQPANVTGSGTGGLHNSNAPDLLPAEILALPKLTKSSFFDDELAAMISNYFCADEALLQATTDEVKQ